MNGPLHPAHTYSIVAADAESGQIGIAVQSHWFSVGSAVPWAEAGVGAVATQSFVNRSFGPRGLALLKNGLAPQQVVEELVAADPGRELRQLAVIDPGGRAAAFTGAKCVSQAGHLVGSCFSVQANLMGSDGVWPAMARTFEQGSGPLAERLVGALEAAQGCGGDLRGQQSAALLVVKARASAEPRQDRLIDLRVEDHPAPLQELRRLLKVFRAYEHMNRGDLALEESDGARALREYGRAQELCPENLEMKYWCAVSLANTGRVGQALPLFADLFRAQASWRTLTQRLFGKGLLEVEEAQYRRILALSPDAGADGGGSHGDSDSEGRRE